MFSLPYPTQIRNVGCNPISKNTGRPPTSLWNLSVILHFHHGLAIATSVANSDRQLNTLLQIPRNFVFEETEKIGFKVFIVKFKVRFKVKVVLKMTALNMPTSKTPIWIPRTSVVFVNLLEVILEQDSN